jgi:hypothetical protein
VENPILDLALFRSRLFTAANLSLFFITFTQSAISVLIPFYLQNLIGFSPTQMGWIIIGSAIIVVGQYLIASLTLESSISEMVLPQVLTGLGWAVFNSPNQSAILGSVSRDRVGAASGMTITTARVGGAIGIALSGAILTYALSSSGLTPEQIESPQSWSAAPAVFLSAFSYTVHLLNIFALLAILFSAIRGNKPE